MVDGGDWIRWSPSSVENVNCLKTSAMVSTKEIRLWSLEVVKPNCKIEIYSDYFYEIPPRRVTWTFNTEDGSGANCSGGILSGTPEKCQCTYPLHFDGNNCVDTPPVIDLSKPDVVLRHGFNVGDRVTLRENSLDSNGTYEWSIPDMNNSDW
jgi:hypothetical protein